MTRALGWSVPFSSARTPTPPGPGRRKAAMKLGFYTYSYIDRLKRDIEPVLQAVAAAGYDGIDISATWHDDLDPAAMPAEARRRYADTARRLGLEIEAVVTHLGLAQALHA